MQARRGPGRCALGSARSVGREGGDARRGGLCALCAARRGCPWQGGTGFAMATYPDAQKTKKNIRTVGFEPTPSKRPVPETGALDRSARSARFSPLVCYITLANSPRCIYFVRQKNPFSSFSPLRRRVPRLTPPHAWTPTRQGRSRALERSCALFSRRRAHARRQRTRRLLSPCGASTRSRRSLRTRIERTKRYRAESSSDLSSRCPSQLTAPQTRGERS